MLLVCAAHKSDRGWGHSSQKLYVGSKGKVKALFAANGEKAWSRSLPSTGYEMVTLLAANDGELSASSGHHSHSDITQIHHHSDPATIHTQHHSHTTSLRYSTTHTQHHSQHHT